MPSLYIITGPAGSGKSTISKRLAESLDRSVLIEGDDIYHHVVGGYVSPWKSGNHLSTFWNVCIKMIETYLSDGFDIVFNYIVNLKDLEILKTTFNNYNINFVVLLANETVLLERDSQRPLDCQMKERCITLLNSFKNANYDPNNILDTSYLSIDETFDIIKNNNRFWLNKNTL